MVYIVVLIAVMMYCVKTAEDFQKIMLMLWFVSWYTSKGEYFSHMVPEYKTYRECQVVCDSLNQVRPWIIHRPMWDFEKANRWEAEIGEYR